VWSAGPLKHPQSPKNLRRGRRKDVDDDDDDERRRAAEPIVPPKRKASSITNEAFELATEILRLIRGPNHRFAWQYALQYRTSTEQADDEARSAHQDEKTLMRYS
jgi:hypothetical protein